MAHQLPELPFSKDALAPHISTETIDYHYGKHHAGYVKKLNDQLEGTGLEKMQLEELITTGIKQAPQEKQTGLFNNAAQVWNHTFYWQCITPGGATTPSRALASAIDETFGSFDKFKMQFSTTAATTFGSGWAWLVKDSGGKLAIISTQNAGTPLTENKTPLLTCDVWEHAYYIDYRNERPKYIEAFWNLVNWDVVAQRFSG